MAVIALAALVVKPDHPHAVDRVRRPVYLKPCPLESTGSGTRHTTNSITPPSGVTSLKRVISLTCMADKDAKV
jgi:hypothetical protein